MNEMIYVFDTNNKLVFETENKAELKRRFGITYKSLMIRLEKKTPFKDYYFAIVADFKIPVQPLSKPKNKAGAGRPNTKPNLKKQQEKEIQKENTFLTYSEANEHKTIAQKVLEKAKLQNKPVRRLSVKDSVRNSLKRELKLSHI
ncbi:hypothetical protein IF125_11515 [Empedobacter stercoris]|uniref:hypothetical protein n=1 Tax=Empedobacter stercoris TaxID=1628248 RepID=UPI001CE19CDF|nr:hypothetical protein [Empedobacter stercoris]MCA4782873.1 hypothetical protein [Empedobacter stercoris]